MNRLKLLLLALITPLLCGISFATNNFDNLQNYIISTGSFTNIWSNVYTGLYLFDTSVSRSVCMAFSWLTSWKYVQWGFQNKISAPNVVIRYSVDFPNDYLWLSCSWWNKDIIVWYTTSTTPVDYVVYDFGAFLSATSDNWGWGSDCSSIQSQLTQCQSDLTSCQNSNCDTQLSQCLEDKSSLQSSYNSLLSSNSSLSGSLSSCLEDKLSLQNYNNSLSTQLNECLLWSWNNWSWTFNYSLFWQDEEMYSLPITNNLFLPTGYKWKLDEDNVLSIAKLNTLESAYMFTEEDKVTIIDILSIVMLFLLATWSIIWLIAFFKHLFTKK